MAKIAVDFDETIVEDRYPKIGPEVMFATDTLRMLIEAHHQLILWTKCAKVSLLKEAVDWCHERGVDFWAINSDYPEEKPPDKYFTRKIKADYFIDDRNIGGLPDWGQIYAIIQQRQDFCRSAERWYNASRKEEETLVESVIVKPTTDKERLYGKRRSQNSLYGHS